MYVIRRIAKTQPGKSWEVAGYLARITGAYESTGRNKAYIYIGNGLPGNQDVVYAEWTQEKIEPTNQSKVPESVLSDHKKMWALLTDYSIEFYELVTPEKLQERDLA